MIWAMMVSQLGLFAQETTAPAPPPKSANWSELQNWIFAGSALITAAIGVFVVSVNDGRGVNER